MSLMATILESTDVDYFYHHKKFSATAREDEILDDKVQSTIAQTEEAGGGSTESITRRQR